MVLLSVMYFKILLFRGNIFGGLVACGCLLGPPRGVWACSCYFSSDWLIPPRRGYVSIPPPPRILRTYIHACMYLYTVRANIHKLA